MNPDSLEESIQNVLSALYPPFEATAPTVLSQLFHVIDGRYQGDTLRCLLDFLVPAKHILESVQQDACAQYSDVIFLCEGWPLCLHDQVLIHLAPIHPLLLRPGDFYFQVVPFYDQSARIVVCSLLEEEGLWVEVVEETPIPETFYPCLFSSSWLDELNQGRHGTPLSQCLLATEQGVVRLPWKHVAVPEFLDGPTGAVTSMASAHLSSHPLSAPLSVPTPLSHRSTASAKNSEPTLSLPVSPAKQVTTKPPTEHIQTSASQRAQQPAVISVETRIRPAKHGIAVSLRLVDTSASASSNRVRVDDSGPKPIGWVSSNIWDSRCTEVSTCTATSQSLGILTTTSTVEDHHTLPSRDNSETLAIVDSERDKCTSSSRQGTSTQRPADQAKSVSLTDGEYIDAAQAAMLFGGVKALRKEEQTEVHAAMQPATQSQANVQLHGQTLMQTATQPQIHSHKSHIPSPRTSHSVSLRTNMESGPLTAHHSQHSHPPDSHGPSHPRELSHCVRTIRFSEGPCTPCMRRKQGGKVSRAQELRCRYRESYQAAIQNPITFLRDKEKGDTLAALDEDSDSSQCEGRRSPEGAKGDLWLSKRSFDPGVKNLPTSPVCGFICKESGEMNTFSWWCPEETNPANCVNYGDRNALKHDRQPEQSTGPQPSGPSLDSCQNTMLFKEPTDAHLVKSFGILQKPNGTNREVGQNVNTIRPITLNDPEREDGDSAKTHGLPPSSGEGLENHVNTSQPYGISHTSINSSRTNLTLSKYHGIPPNKRDSIEPDGRCSSLSTAVVDTSEKCELVIVQGQNVRRRESSDNRAEMIPRLHVVKCKNSTAFGLVSPKISRRKTANAEAAQPGSSSTSDVNGSEAQNVTQSKLCPAADIQKISHPCSARPRPDHLPLSLPEPVVHPLFQGVACLTGGRDRAGRAIVEVYGDHHGWRSPLSSKELYQMLLYFHTVIRREVRELGLTVVVDVRRAPPPPQFFKALATLQETTRHALHCVMLLVDKEIDPWGERYMDIQSDVVTSTKALYKLVEACHLTMHLDGTLPYDHRDWLELHQKLHRFVLDLHESSSLLLRAIRRLEEKQKIDTVQNVQQCIEDQRTLMRDVLEDSRVVSLQREGGAILARLRRESDLKYPHREDFSDAVDSVTSLYNYVEEQAHILVQRSNMSLEHLDYLLHLRELETHFMEIREWFKEEGECHLLEAESVEDSKDRVEQTLNTFTSFLIEANDRKQHAMSLVSEAERLQACGLSYPEAEVVGTLIRTFRVDLEDFLSRADVCCRDLGVMVGVCDFCEQATALASECIEYLDQNQCNSYLMQNPNFHNTTIHPSNIDSTQDQHNDPSQDPSHTQGQAQHMQYQNPGNGSSFDYEATLLKSYQERFLHFSLEQFQEVRTQASTLRGSRGMRAWNVAWLKCQEARQQLQERVQEVDEAYLQRQHAALLCDCQDIHTGANAHTALSDGEDRLLQSTPGPRHLQWEGIISGTVEIDKRRPILGSSSANANGQSENAIAARSSDGSKVIPASPQRSSRRTESGMSREGNNRGRSERDAAAALSRSHTVGCQWFPWGRGLAARSMSEESCVTISAPLMAESSSPPAVPRVRSPSSCSRHGQPSCRILQDAQRFQISRHGSFCSQESFTGADGATGDNGASCCGHPSLPIQRCEGSLCLASAEERSGSSLRLQRVMEELVHTEREYVRSLGYILTHYHPLMERPDIPQDLRGKRGVIFGNLEKLYDFHSHYFLPELEACQRGPAAMARCFIRHSEGFGLYALYSKNKPKSDALILQRRHDIFKRKQQELGDMMDLSSYLLRPIQRISKYSLLLQDMLALADDHILQPQDGVQARQYQSSTACGAGVCVADTMGAEREGEKSEIQAAADLVKFQMRHGNDLLTMDAIRDCEVNLKEQGQLVRQDEFTVFFRKKKCVRRVFLFQHLILFSKTKRTEVGNDVYVYKQSFKTCDIGMTHNSGVSALCFEFWIRRRRREDTYTLKAVNMEVKKAWTTDLEKILWEQAAHSRELGMQERVFMGMGRKPFVDIHPSEAAIRDRAVSYALSGRIPVAYCSHRGLEYPRPSSIGSGSTVSTTISQSSSSSGRGSLPPIGYLGSQSQAVTESSPVVCSSSEALAENEINNRHLLQQHLHHNCEQRTMSRHFQMDSTESSGECISPFSSSEHSCLSAIGGEVVDSSSSFASPNSKTRPPLSRTPSLRINGSPALHRRKPIGVPKSSTLAPSQGRDIFIGKSTEV